MPFQKDQPIKHMILLCDVDGVVRDSTESEVDSRVVHIVKKLISTNKVHAAFISGTPISQIALEIWRRANITLDVALGKAFNEEILNQKVTLFGCLGGQKMNHEGKIETVESYSIETVFELGKLLVRVFLEEVIVDGTHTQKQIATNLLHRLEALILINSQQIAAMTPIEFQDIVLEIRQKIDPEFRLISYGSFVETQSSNPPWQIERSKKKLNAYFDSHPIFKNIPSNQKQIASGVAHRAGKGFNFLLICKTNKGPASRKHIEDKLGQMPDALVVTIGDSQVDFPMHQHADLSFHVGKAQVLKEHTIAHCSLVTDDEGNDSQHVTGTLKVLNNIYKNFFN